jgi:hypothetical protein
MGQGGTGAGFLLVFRFLPPILIPPTAPCSSAIIWGWEHQGKLFPNVAHVTVHNICIILLKGWSSRLQEHTVVQPEGIKHNATSRKVADSSPDVVDFFSIYLILPAALWPWGRISL